MTNDTPPLALFAETIDPYHACIGPDCSYPPGMYLLVMQDASQPDDPSAYLTSVYVHNVHPNNIVQSVVNFVDQTFQENRGDDEPAMIAHARARDLLRAAVETMPPPPVVSQEISDFAEDNLSAWKGLIDG